jgi:hypothetical protein
VTIDVHERVRDLTSFASRDPETGLPVCPVHMDGRLHQLLNGLPACTSGCSPESLMFNLGADLDLARAIHDQVIGGYARIAQAAAGTASRLMTWDELRELPETTWLVEGVLPDVGVAQLVGPTGEGKTFVALDLALRIANGASDWHGHTVERTGQVLYVLMEGMHDWRRRVDAWLVANGGSADALLTMAEETVDLASPESVERLAQDIELKEAAPVLIVVDTQALATPGTDENNNSDMGLVMSHLKRLAQRHRCLVMTVHHTGHDKTRARGASAQKAALDAEIFVNNGTIAVSKVKSAARPRPVAFRLTPSGASVWASPVHPMQAALAGMSAARGKVLQAVADAGEGGLNRSAVYKAVRGDRTTCFGSLDELVEAGTLTETQAGRSKVYRVAEPL